MQSVQVALKDIPSEIIVVDNNSSDESCTIVKLNFPDVKLIENKDNVGFSKANNQAVAVAKGEYICILNPDVVVAENTFHDLINFSKSKAKHGIIVVDLLMAQEFFFQKAKEIFLLFLSHFKSCLVLESTIMHIMFPHWKINQ